MKTDAALDEADLLRFAELIEERLGLQFDSSSLKELEAILLARMRTLRCAGIDTYLHRFEAPGLTHEELRELATVLTIGETYFLRSPEQFTVFSEVALPRLTHAQPARKLRILSAGCATGEEPYTLAITLRELGALAPEHVSILGLDVNPESISRARRGRYSPWAMRATSPELLQKYFRRDRDQFVLDESVRRMVRFEERNLALEDIHFWQPQSFDVIFCRNVTMYLSARALGELITRFARVLAPAGFLFLSYTEPLRGISQAFHVEHAHGAFYYVVRAPSQSPAPCAAPRTSAAPAAATAAVVRRAVPLAVRDLTTQPLGSTGAPELPKSLALGAVLMIAERFDERWRRWRRCRRLNASNPTHSCSPR